MALDAEAMCWRASRYKLKVVEGDVVIEAAPDAIWKRFSPFDSYQPTNKARELKAGPHLHFLQLKGQWEKQEQGQLRLPHKPLRQTEAFHNILSQTKQVDEIQKQGEEFYKDLTLFAREYGLLGTFEQYFPSAPVLPRGKTLVAPEAVIDDHGSLQRFDPATKGKDLLLRLLEPRGHFSAGHFRLPDQTERTVAYEMMAVPSEVSFAPRDPHLEVAERSVEHSRLVPWEVIKKHFGALLILDARAPDGVSVLCRREPLRRWKESFRFFPGASPSGDVELDDDNYVFLNEYLEDVSPRAFIGKDGNLQRGWRYRGLLQAMYVMLFLDLTGGNTLRKCQSRPCPTYFRAGPQSKSKYCSKRCANRASTRMGRGQAP